MPRLQISSSSKHLLIAVLAGIPLLLLLLWQPVIILAFMAVLALPLLWKRVSLYRLAIITAVCSAGIRSGFSDLLPTTVWYALIFGPILLTTVITLAFKTGNAPQEKTRRFGLSWALVLLLAAVLVSAVVAKASSGTYEQWGLLVLIIAFLLVTIAKRWHQETLIRKDMVSVFAALTLLNVAGIVAKFAGLAWATDPDFGRFRGIFSNANYAGMTASLGIALAIYLVPTRPAGRGKFWYLFSLSVFIIALMLSGSRGSMLALGIGIVAWLVSRHGAKYIIPACLFLVPLGAIAWWAFPSFTEQIQASFDRTFQRSDITSGRSDIYYLLLDIWRENPIFGIGYRATEELDVTGGLTAHNVYLSMLVETGILGFSAFALVILVILRAGRKRKTMSLFVPAFVILIVEVTESSLFGFGGPTALAFWMILGAYASLGMASKEPEPDDAPVVKQKARPTVISRPNQSYPQPSFPADK